MKFAGIVEAAVAVLGALGHIGRRDGELSVDLVERVLGGREAELVLEERRLGRILVRVGQVQPLGRVQ